MISQVREGLPTRKWCKLLSDNELEQNFDPLQSCLLKSMSDWTSLCLNELRLYGCDLASETELGKSRSTIPPRRCKNGPKKPKISQKTGPRAQKSRANSGGNWPKTAEIVGKQLLMDF